jgi:uncharacterized protein YkwD
MRRGALSVCAVVLCAFFAAPGANPQSLSRTRSASGARDEALIAAVNSVRAIHLLPKLSVDRCLRRAAIAHSLDMLRRDYFGHADFAARMWRFHVRGHVFGENLAYSSGLASARVTVSEWLASPPHRAILLDPKLRRIGVATPVGAFGNWPAATLITADFAG